MFRLSKTRFVLTFSNFDRLSLCNDWFNPEHNRNYQIKYINVGYYVNESSQSSTENLVWASLVSSSSFLTPSPHSSSILSSDITSKALWCGVQFFGY